MAEEGKGIAFAILGIVAVIAVVGLVLLFKGATGKAINYAYGVDKVYGGINYGQEFPYLIDRTSGGFPSAAGNPPAADGNFVPPGFYMEKPVPVELEENMPPQGSSDSGTRSRISFQRQPGFVPSGQICAAAPGGETGLRCPQGTLCIPNYQELQGGQWIPAPSYPCFVRANNVPFEQ